ncbi:MAG: ABC transporter ATP-binding protein [Deltaproteobacteria bacterium]|nr:ABC transporter ATP-binding protein [Deltaproteobacteria bacterium]MBW1952249.1 ABC transporter ATP-binding protein [Deltaproteobacteria bacterium]MBW1986039.1 ABC transporter ATP-binding protein [Deltaproteobacteria bacterium]MBW2133956.1 ABC transporter ATP-binding protein [Deltaproteobacteria bacterium]
MRLPLIELQNISFAYPGHREVLQNCNFQLFPGERLGLVGANGSGKTTLLHIIMGLLPPQEGKVLIFGQEVRQEKDFARVRKNIGLVFQNADDQLFCPTVLEDVAFGPLNQGKSPQEAIQIALATLDQLHLSGFENRVTYKLSGGEKKLVSLATVLAMRPQVLLLDEPSNGLDERTKNWIVHVLSELEMSYVIVSHDSDFLQRTTEKLYTMAQGRILAEGESLPTETGPPEEFQQGHTHGGEKSIGGKRLAKI